MRGDPFPGGWFRWLADRQPAWATAWAKSPVMQATLKRTPRPSCSFTQHSTSGSLTSIPRSSTATGSPTSCFVRASETVVTISSSPQKRERNRSRAHRSRECGEIKRSGDYPERSPRPEDKWAMGMVKSHLRSNLASKVRVEGTSRNHEYPTKIQPNAARTSLNGDSCEPSKC